MISVALARQLRDSGLRWHPAAGDRFVVADRGMDDEVFTLADMTVDVHNFPGGAVIGFNGTVEWALDSIDVQASVWLPSEAQLRERLGGAFVSLDRDGADWRVRLTVAGRPVVVTDPRPAEAYGRALLELINATK